MSNCQEMSPTPKRLKLTKGSVCMYVCLSISHSLRWMAEGYDIMSLKDSRSFIKSPAEVGGVQMVKITKQMVPFDLLALGHFSQVLCGYWQF